MRASYPLFVALLSLIAVAAAGVATATPAAAQPVGKPSLDTGGVDRGVFTGFDPRGGALTTEAGVVLTTVDAASVWHKLGLRAGDTVLTVNGFVVTDEAELARQIETATRDGVIVYVEILRKKKLVLLRRVITGAPPASFAPLPDSGPMTPDEIAAAAAAAELAAELDRIVRHKGGTTWEVEVDALLANPYLYAKGARVMPSTKDGKPNGFKLYAVRPSSIYARLGINNGDTILRVNGVDLTSMDVALEVYAKARTASTITVDIIRRGKPLTHTYLRKPAKPAKQP